MNINRVLMEYDSMFGKNSLADIENYLVTNIEMAYEETDYYAAITLLNEFMGFCRDTSQNEKGKECCRQTIELMDKMELAGTVEYATSLLNVANAYRAYGMLEESLELYHIVEENYQNNLSPNEFNYASLYNNWSLLYQEMNDFDSAETMLKKALRIVDRYPNAVVEQATTRTNLAVTMFQVSQNEKNGVYGEERIAEAEHTYKEAMSYLNHALKIYEKDGGRDFHYSAALSAMGDALYMVEDYAGAAKYYDRAMVELEKHVGRTEAYDRIQEKYESAFRRSEMDVNVLKDTLFRDVPEQAEETEEAGDAEEDEEVPGDEEAEEKKYFKNNMQRCRTFYREQGVPMIQRLFPQYEERIAVGLVGEGSDCFGFDDAISMDHDYGVGFCMWLTDEDYDAISGKLQMEYEALITKYGDNYRMLDEKDDEVVRQEQDGINRFIDARRGVFKISEFYNKLLLPDNDLGTVDLSDYSDIPEEFWYKIRDEELAAAVNGQIFRDDLGEFTKIRERLLGYYPRKVWMLKLAEQLHYFSQYAQSNYERMMAREDYTTAMMCVSKAAECAMRIAYILDKTYAPYYKWMRKGMDNLHKLKDVGIMLDDISRQACQMDAWTDKEYNPYSINEDDVVILSFESIAKRIHGELVAAGLITGDSTFLDHYCQMLVDSATGHTRTFVVTDESTEDITEDTPVDEPTETIAQEPVKTKKDELVDDIVMHEWQQFDKVENEGGRADCQDDWNTFSLMRRSQYMAWNEDLLESYRGDLLDAEERGWNLITEKYARMMKSTSPEQYAELADTLPVRDEERTAIQEEIIKIQVEWMEEFAAKYPKMAGNARKIHTYEDNPVDTSYETYLRGELGTYSDETLVRYGQFIVDTKKGGRNLAYIIMNNTAKGYGYNSVADAEMKM
ncbi:MAG: DUF4125 family protein [Muribaculaceae bacterium]|nr:DUF4125 family protein [Muribaculaceae bacterium]MCM1398973.1 DUF4125 family protein [Clostridium sp.]MCM1458831.1 DUF4125 family protein [Bacteroides sp.]